jgi:hypothetical protein
MNEGNVAGMPDLHEVEQLVRSALSSNPRLEVTGEVAGGELILTVRRVSPSSPTGRASARIVTSGVEGFYLYLDSTYDYQEFDWAPEGQRESVILLAKLAESYLDGQGDEEERRGLFGRVRKELTLQVDGETYIVKSSGSPSRGPVGQ